MPAPLFSNIIKRTTQASSVTLMFIQIIFIIIIMKLIIAKQVDRVFLVSHELHLDRHWRDWQKSKLGENKM